MPDTIIDFIRHGEPVGGRRYRGNGCNDPLSDLGWEQMWRAVGNDCPWQAILSSPLQRCAAFARALGERHGLPVTWDERLREVGFGTWEGRTPGELAVQDPESLEAFLRDPVRDRPAGAEPLDGFGRRVSAAIADMTERYAGRHLLCVAHAGVIRAVIGHVLAASPDRWYRIRVANAGMTRVRFDRYGPALDFHNLPPGP